MSLDLTTCARLRALLIFLSAVLVAGGSGALAQGPAPGAGGTGAGGRGGRGGIALPGATPEQTAAVAAMNAALTEQTAAVTAARSELAQATFADPRNATALAVAIDKVRAAELALALKRAAEFATLQGGPNKLSADQVAALIAASSNAGRGGPPAVPGGAGRGPAGGAMAPAGRSN